MRSVGNWLENARAPTRVGAGAGAAVLNPARTTPSGDCSAFRASVSECLGYFEGDPNERKQMNLTVVHRRLSITSTLAIITNLLVQGHEKLALWVGLLTLPPLALLLLTGLYLFALPYLAKRTRQGENRA